MKVKLFILLLVSIGMQGCDIFSTRSAEPPTTPRTNLPLAFEYETLIDNFIASYRERSIFDYLNCFSDSVFTNKEFSFVASSGAESQYPALQDWNIRYEEDFFRNLTSEIMDVPVIIILSNENFSQQGDSIIFTASYSLSVPFIDSGIPQNYQGGLIFYIIRDNNLIWKIYFWQDIKSSDLPSWSELKGRLSN